MSGGSHRRSIGAKRSSYSEVINQQLDPYSGENLGESQGAMLDAQGIDERPMLEEFDEHEMLPGRESKRMRLESRRKASVGRLSHRSEIFDPALSAGKYVAKPVQSSAAFGGEEDATKEKLSKKQQKKMFESNVDDIFEMLEGDEEEDRMLEGGGESFNENNNNKKLQTEEEFEEWWKKNRKGKVSSTMKLVRKLYGDQEDEDRDIEEEEEEENELEDGNVYKVKVKGEQEVEKSFVVEKKGDRDVLKQVKELRQRQEEIFSPSGKKNEDDEEEEEILLDNSLPSSYFSVVHHSRDVLKVIGELIQLRLKLQSSVSKALRMPQYYSHVDFLQFNDGAGGRNKNSSSSSLLSKNYQETKKSIVELCYDLLQMGNGGGEKAMKQQRSNNDRVLLWEDISKYHQDTIATIDTILENISSQMMLTSAMGATAGGKNSKKFNNLQAINRPFLDQLHAVLEGGKARFCEKIQRNRSHVKILGHPVHFLETMEERAKRIASDGGMDLDHEIFDDPDFLRELIHKNHLVTVSLTQAAAVNASSTSTTKNGSVTAAELERELTKSASNKTSRVGLHKLTKGKKVSFEPRPKLVGFMAPVAYDQSNVHHDAIVASLFQ